jgi:crossover junction endodeoxyribonuclease RuvC
VGISLQQFNQMKDRLGGSRRAAAPVLETGLRRAAAVHQIILGVDPSLRGTGYGVIRLAKPGPDALSHGTITCPPAWEHSRCLVRIAQTLRDVIRQHQPTLCVIEGLFFAQNIQTALTMGEARGAALSAIGESGLEIYEISPRKVKQAIVGYGAAQKLAVAKMVQRLLHLAETPAADAADALALALAHAQVNGRYSFSTPKRI